MSRFKKDSEAQKEFQFLKDPKHVAIPLEEAIGKEVLCEDGVRRTVSTIIHCAGSFQYAVINEDLAKEDAGHLVHLLKLFCELRNSLPPTEEELSQFDAIAKSFFYEYKGREEGEVFTRKPVPKPKPKTKRTFFRTKGGTNAH